MREFTVLFKPVIVQVIEAETWEEAVEKFKESLKESSVDISDAESFEIEDGTPKSEELLKLYEIFKKIIERSEQMCSPDSTDVMNVGFKEEDEDEFVESGCDLKRVPNYVYCDIHVYDMCGEYTIHKNVEYDVGVVLKRAKELKLLKEKEVGDE